MEPSTRGKLYPSYLLFLPTVSSSLYHIGASLSSIQVESIVLSIISMLSSPNDESPANIDAAKQWREDRDGFKKRVARIVRKSQEML